MSNIKLFDDAQIRVSWNADEEDWYFSIVDVVATLINSDYQTARNYWKVLKNRLNKEGSELVTKCNRLKLAATDGKMRQTDVLKTKDVLRLIQSIPSPKAEPFKLWLAQVGSERLDEIEDPEKTFERGIQYYRQKGYSEEWIKQRITSIDIRRELTDEFKTAGVTDSKDYAILTNELTRSWSGMSVKEYKEAKGLKKEGLRDNMSNLELTLNMLAEATTVELCKANKPVGFDETLDNVREGGTIANDARKKIEKKTRKSIISNTNIKKLGNK
ncbi:MAG: phage antirepressor protein [Erysipelotrichales bacterium]|nr:phage antirepressor protein [Erysipelotrichales bacterium]